ncbi:Opioid growth factor receptor (OGFr) conserved region [Roseomonas rosea]|uniref:Opioid growth factor receptor (OGFr) conserved region n=1 Tax=Muricoccus roseus TaxID=198092 RepID=A0A1M6DMS1_9PROT|nr:opioid growth factor receptor-related protein [Roseomonas rosea]SHI74399.1 Opioid growth factor receptor (OGFr) conserved region [Roseomonas rosea]
MADRILRFLRGEGPDSQGRFLRDVLAFDDGRLEARHDFIQWLFPLPEPSRAVPGSPVLSPEEASAIRADPRALKGLRAALGRMSRFYAETDHWLTRFDHNHLRITRIIAATRELLGREAAAAFHDAITARNAAAGHAVNDDSLRHWARALG